MDMSVSFNPGTIYLVKSPLSLFWSTIESLPNIEFVWKPSLTSLVEQVCYDSAFAEPATFVVVPGQLEDVLGLPAPADSHYVFWLLSSPTGEFNKTADKIWRAANAAHLIQLDLTRHSIGGLDKVKESLSRFDNEVAACLLNDFSNVSRLMFQMSQPETQLLEYEVYGVAEREAIPLLTCLGKPESIERWSNLPRRIIYGLFITPEGSDCGMRIILSFGSREQRLPAFCPALWLYMDMFMQHLLPFYKDYPQHLLRLFASWVYLSTTVWAVGVDKGFTSRSINGKTYYTFRPSARAHAEALKLFRGQLH